MIDDLFDFVFVLLLNAGLSLHMVDDEGRCVLKDLAVLVGQCQVGACDWSGGLLRALLLTLQSKKNKTSVKKIFLAVYSQPLCLPSAENDHRKKENDLIIDAFDFIEQGL